MARAATRKTRLPRMLGPFASRPRLALAFAVGGAVGAGGFLAGLNWTTSVIFGWDATCLAFILAALPMMAGADTLQMKAVAATQDEGQAAILGVVTLAAAASIGVVAVELAEGQAGGPMFAALRLALVFLTVAASWFMVQLIFALHYAHEYYGTARDGRAGTVAGGLAFPGGGDPDYWDFLHFSAVIGVACQTADIAFTSKALRRTGTVQGIIAFVFNTVILALTINTAAGLF